jgi:hypothetical protein
MTRTDFIILASLQYRAVIGVAEKNVNPDTYADICINTAEDLADKLEARGYKFDEPYQYIPPQDPLDISLYPNKEEGI